MPEKFFSILILVVSFTSPVFAVGSSFALDPANLTQERLQQSVRTYFSRLGIQWVNASIERDVVSIQQDITTLQETLANAPDTDRLFYIQSLFDAGTRVWLQEGNLSPTTGKTASGLIRTLGALHKNGLLKFRLNAA